ncbi:MAG: ATP-binding protein, partial [Gammaproteobacteria bacterium]
VWRYRSRISGPLLDRLDLHVEVPRPPREALRPGAGEPGEPSEAVRQRVVAARDRQIRRTPYPNARLTNADIEQLCRPAPDAARLLDAASEKLGLSARAYHRILKVARTIADLAGDQVIAVSHVSEAIGLRCLDRRPTMTG